MLVILFILNVFILNMLRESFGNRDIFTARSYDYNNLALCLVRLIMLGKLSECGPAYLLVKL